MNRFWPVHAVGIFCALFIPSWALCQSKSILGSSATAAASKLPYAVIAYLPDNPDLPPGMLNLMRTSQLKYLEGSRLIKSGESEKARIAFNKAVDLLLESDWDLNSNVEFNRFFQDLIHRIQQDESRYLRPPDLDEKAESAVVDELEKLDLIPITVDPALQDVVEADLADTSYDVPVTLNERVLKSLNYWLSKGRKLFINGLLRSGRYRDMIESVFREQSIPLDIMYLAQVESLFKPNAVSRALAKGIWQFSKGTALNYGLKVNNYIDERSDPEKSTVAAARYLNDLYAMFKDWNLVLAAYNCGEGKVQQLMDKSGLNSFWELVDLRRNFPLETQNHVPLIIASIILAHNPEKYGLPKELDPSLRFEKVPVSRPVDLRAAARLLKVSLEELKQLNPALRGLSTPPGYPDFKLNVPSDTGQDVRQKIAALPAVRIRPETELASRHKIQTGETLEMIARKYGVSVTALKSANNIKIPNRLRAGTWIKIPSTRSSGMSAGRSPSRAKASPSRSNRTGGFAAQKSTTGSKAGTKKVSSTDSASRSDNNTASKSPARVTKPPSKINPGTAKKTIHKEIASR